VDNALALALAIAGRSAELYTLVEDLTKGVVLGQFEQDRRYVQLASAILEIRSGGYWRNWGEYVCVVCRKASPDHEPNCMREPESGEEFQNFGTFGKYIVHLTKVVNKERSTLYGYLSVAETLLPVVGQDVLEAVGINKGLALRAGMKVSGRTPSKELMAKAADPAVTAGQLQADINTEFKIHPPEGEGKWRVLEFYADDEDWAAIQQAIETAKREDPPISNTLPEHAQLREVLLRWAAEFESTYGKGSSK
jgi:hypothetical protein